MSNFVDQCRSEWKRLGVPEPLAAEMAADLEADLSEAQADGVSPEAVLGNGYFDPTSFAASWASARGIVNPQRSWRTLIPPRIGGHLIATVASVAAILVGLLLLVGRQASSVAAFPVSISSGPVRRVIVRPFSAISPGITRSIGFGPGGAAPIGAALVVAGLIALGVTLLLWKPWSKRGRDNGFDQNVGMPSYL